MRHGAARLSIPFDGATFDRHLDALLLEERVLGRERLDDKADTPVAADTQSAVAKIILTRGSGGRGYAPPDDVTPRWIVQRFALLPRPTRQRRDGMVLGLCDDAVVDSPNLAGLKHLNRLDQVLAQQQVLAAGWDEGLLLDQRRRPLELTSMNLFFRFANELVTPDLRCAGVAGVARQWCLQHAASHGVTCRQKNISLTRLREADEVFACNSVAGILPIRQLGLWQWPAGKLTLSLQAEFDALFV
jgi:4-amino-4-deoxychorismate lyase